jgi:hypothetical protein
MIIKDKVLIDHIVSYTYEGWRSDSFNEEFENEKEEQ